MLLFTDDGYYGAKERIIMKRKCFFKVVGVTAALTFGSIALKLALTNSDSGLVEGGVT